MKMSCISLFLLFTGFLFSCDQETALPGRYAETGLASYYADVLHGEKTASGEPYDKNKLTAAHRSLALGTHVQVINLENNRQVRVRINDRGPFIDDRIIDLSYAAAQSLDMVEKGVVRVKVVSIEEDLNR
jgi:rare lipoprotein A